MYISHRDARVYKLCFSSFGSFPMDHHVAVIVLVLLLRALIFAYLWAVSLLPAFDSSASILLKDAWSTSLLRWDLFHFLHIAERGYVYEYEFAFFPGAPYAMRIGSQLLKQIGLDLSTGTTHESLLVGGVVFGLVANVIAAVTLYDLTLHYFPRSPNFAYLTVLLSLLSSSPATLHHTPCTEPFFTCLSYLGVQAQAPYLIEFTEHCFVRYAVLCQKEIHLGSTGFCPSRVFQVQRNVACWVYHLGHYNRAYLIHISSIPHKCNPSEKDISWNLSCSASSYTIRLAPAQRLYLLLLGSGRWPSTMVYRTTSSGVHVCSVEVLERRFPPVLDASTTSQHYPCSSSAAPTPSCIYSKY